MFTSSGEDFPSHHGPALSVVSLSRKCKSPAAGPRPAGRQVKPGADGADKECLLLLRLSRSPK